MTAASQHLASPAPRAPRWERLLIFFGICLPVPLLAATGLTIPLPGTVERLAAALVPWVETAMIDSNRALLGGTIVLAPGEHPESAAPGDMGATPVSEQRSPTQGHGQGSGEAKPSNGTEAGVAPNPTSPDAGPPATPGESSPAPAPKPDPTEKPGDEPGPIQGTVDTVGQVVGGAEGTLDEVLPPAADGVLGGTVTGLLPGLGG